MPKQYETAVAIAVIDTKIDEIRVEIHALAEKGDIDGCDVLHQQIDHLQTTQAILSGEL